MTKKYGQIIIGPPGSGKSTYCNGMQQYLKYVNREVLVINLDPANDNLPYDCNIDICDLIYVDNVMKEKDLGPNGALLFCISYLYSNIDWLKNQIEKKISKSCNYLLFDCPGQVETYTIDDSFKKIIEKIISWNIDLTCVHLIDSIHCHNVTNYISALLLSLSAMLHLELSHVNILSKIDLLENICDLNFQISYFSEARNLEYLISELSISNDPWDNKLYNLTSSIAELVTDYSLVNFLTLNISNGEDMKKVLYHIDKSNGYCYFE